MVHCGKRMDEGFGKWEMADGKPVLSGSRTGVVSLEGA
jgi:hypothetical protein